MVSLEYFKKVKLILEEIISDKSFNQNIENCAQICIQSLKKGGKIIFCGNGGSAAESQHLSAELVSKFNYDRPALASISLTVDTSALTAIGNDYGYIHSFSRQLKALGKPEDILIGLSTSGKSLNVLEAFKAAKEIGITTIGMLGMEGREIGEIADFSINIPSNETPHIQEGHAMVGHILCSLIEDSFFKSSYDNR